MPVNTDKKDIIRVLTEKLENVNSPGKLQYEERIHSLETENALLHLKIAHLHGQIRERTHEWALYKQKLSSDGRCKAIVTRAGGIANELKILREENGELRRSVHSLVEAVHVDCEAVHQQLDHCKQIIHSHTNSTSELHRHVVSLEQAVHDMTERYLKEKRKRKNLHNTFMELRGNIRVQCRIRPLLDIDASENERNITIGKAGTSTEKIMDVFDDDNVVVRTPKQNRYFDFERVYAPFEGQDVVFDEVEPLVTSALDGFNVCIMAYGQTGSGKSHTMIGSHKKECYSIDAFPHEEEGIIPRAVRELFRLMADRPTSHWEVSVSVVEIYNNDVYDLLSDKTKRKHDLVTNADGSIICPTVESRRVIGMEEVMCHVRHGLHARSEASTSVHEHSSRSHLIVTITVDTTPPSTVSSANSSPTNTTTERRRRPSCSNASRYPRSPPLSPHSQTSSMGDVDTAGYRTQLHLVDLAGSESVGVSCVTGSALRETSNINRSLSALADVLTALSEQRTHVPYRNSRLTHFLQDSIGGDAKLLLVLCVSPARRFLSESLQCLNFGQRARQVQRGPIKRQGGRESPRSSRNNRSPRMPFNASVHL